MHIIRYTPWNFQQNLCLYVTSFVHSTHTFSLSVYEKEQISKGQSELFVSPPQQATDLLTKGNKVIQKNYLAMQEI